MTNSDISLLKQIQTADKEAIRSLYHLAYNDCKNIVILHNGAEKEAKDLFKKAILAFIKNSQKTDFQLTVPPKIYLYTLCQDLWRNEKSDTHSDTNTSTKSQTNSIGDIIGECLEKMGPDSKEILISFYYKKMSIKEIADRMNSTVAVIKVKKKKYMDAIKNQFDNLLREPSGW